MSEVEVTEEDLTTSLITGTQMLQWLSSPTAVERRAENLMTMAEAIGIDAARHITERILRKERAIYTLFETELLAPVARAHLDGFLGHWIGSAEDWGALMAAHKLEVGEKDQDPTVHIMSDRPKLDDPEDAEMIPVEARFGSHISEMDDDVSLNGIDELTDSSFGYTRFRKPPVGDDE